MELPNHSGRLYGVWLFYVQHQFEMTLWAHDSEWTFQEAALRGKSYYDLPGVLRSFTAISACTMFITYAVASRITGTRALATIVILVSSRGLRCCKASAACVSRFGTRVSAASFHFATQVLAYRPAPSGCMERFASG